MHKILFALFVIATIVVSITTLSGCARPSDTGLVAGGILGGAAGSALTRGSTVGTVAGAVGGALIGREVVRRNY